MDFFRALSVATALLLVACSPKEEASAPAMVKSRPAPRAPPAAPPPAQPMLNRAELLAAVAAAASAQASGAASPEEAAALAGRRFSLHQPFGCFGPAPEAGAGYTLDEERGVLKVTVRPETWTDAEWARTLVATPETEALEGFWLRRPWMTAETCPAPPLTPGAPPSPETVGLVQVFQTEGSRLPRRGGRAYEATEKVEPAAAIAAGGFRLTLEGRVAETSPNGPVRCRTVHPDQRPVCLVVVTIDRVAFEAADGRQLAEWRN